MRRSSFVFLVVLIGFAACTQALPELHDEFDQKLVEVSGWGEEGAYVLGSRFELRAQFADDATILVEDPTVLEVEDLDDDRFAARALAIGRTRISFREDRHDGWTTVTVAEPDEVEWSDATAVVRGELARAPLRFLAADGSELRGRGVVNAAEGADVVVPERGQDELWVVGEGDAVEVVLDVAGQSFDLDLDVVEVDAVQRLQIDRVGESLQARAYMSGERAVIGAPIAWSVDGEDLPPSDGTPGDRLVPAEGGSSDERTVCARVGAIESCSTVWWANGRPIVL